MTRQAPAIHFDDSPSWLDYRDWCRRRPHRPRAERMTEKAEVTPSAMSVQTQKKIPLEWAILFLVITINWMAEFINAALEAVVNLASPEIHPMARVCKDVGAAAVLLASVAALIIGPLVIGPPLLQRLAPLIAQLFAR